MKENLIQTSTKLNILNSNHITYRYDKLDFEIFGGINPENYQSLRVMLVSSHNRKKHRENVDLINYDQVTSYISKVATETGLHRDNIRQAISNLTDQLEEYKLELRYSTKKPVVKSYQLSDTDRDEAIEILKQPKLLNVLNDMMDKAGIIGNENNRLVLFLCYLTRKTNTSLHAVIQSQFNYLQNKLAELIPEEESKIIGDISESSMFYFLEEELQNKVILVEDTITNRKHLRPLLRLQQNNNISRTTVVKNEYAELVTIQKWVKGNVSISISTQEEQAFSQNGILSFVLSEETGNTQDEKTLLYQRKQSAGLINRYNEQKIITQIQNLQRVLQPVTVINPFALELQLPAEIKNKQITNLHYLKFIEVITFLNQYQRKEKTNEETGEIFIETTLEDIKEANQLLAEIMVSKADHLNRPTRIYLEQLKKQLEAGTLLQEGFTLNEVSRALRMPKTSIERYTKTLVESGLINLNGKGDRKSGYQYQLNDLNEYTELKSSINKVMEATIISIERSTPAPQNKSGALKALQTKEDRQVHQKPQKGIEEADNNTSSNKRKAG